VLSHYDAEYDSTPRVFKGWCLGRHFACFFGTRTVTVTFCTCTGTTVSGTGTTTGLTTTGTSTIRLLFSQLSSFSPTRESFVYLIVPSIHRAFFLFRLRVKIRRYISYYQKILFPTKLVEESLLYQVCE